MEFTLLAAAAMGVAGFWLMLRWEAARGNAAACAVDLWDVGLMAVIGGLVIGRLWSMTMTGVNLFTDPAQIILIRSGVSTEAAAIGSFGVFALLTRRNLLVAADGISAAALAGLAGWHAGCLPTSACLGTTTDLPWAWALDAGSVTRHPTELYAAILLALGAIGIAAWKQRGRPPTASAAGAALAIACGVRLLTEPLRISLGATPTAFYAVGALLGAVIIGVAYVVRLRNPAPPAHRGAI